MNKSFKFPSTAASYGSREPITLINSLKKAIPKLPKPFLDVCMDILTYCPQGNYKESSKCVGLKRLVQKKHLAQLTNSLDGLDKFLLMVK